MFFPQFPEFFKTYSFISLWLPEHSLLLSDWLRVSCFIHLIFRFLIYKIEELVMICLMVIQIPYDSSYVLWLWKIQWGDLGMVSQYYEILVTFGIKHQERKVCVIISPEPPILKKYLRTIPTSEFWIQFRLWNTVFFVCVFFQYWIGLLQKSGF